MNIIQEELAIFNNNLLKFHIPRWNELPDIELYMDQVITFLEKNISILSVSNKEKFITPSMINNYVKLNLIPKPIKKKYNKTHLAYLIAISILKHVFTIQEVRDGISFQAKISGEKGAYNLFCEEQEMAIKYLVNQINLEGQSTIPNINITAENLVIKTATLAFASKIIASQTIKLQQDFMKEKESFNSI